MDHASASRSSTSTTASPPRRSRRCCRCMAEGYAEMYDQYVYAGPLGLVPHRQRRRGRRHLPGHRGAARTASTWSCARCRSTPASSTRCSQRIEADKSPEELVPTEIVFTAERAGRDLRGDPARSRCPRDVLRPPRASSSASSTSAAWPRRSFEFKSKDTLQARRADGGRGVHRAVPARQEGAPLHPDRERRLGARVPDDPALRQGAGLLPRPRRRWSSRTCGRSLPWVLHEKLVPNARSPFFEAEERQALLQDRVALDPQHVRHGAWSSSPRHEPLPQEGAGAARRARRRAWPAWTCKTAEKRIGRVTAADRAS